MWLSSLCVSLFLALGSCAILNPPELQLHQIFLPRDEEGPYYHVRMINERIKGLLQGHHEYIMNRMNSIEAACESSANSRQNEIGYQEPSGPFKDPRLNLLVKTMTRKMTDIASIFMDDLEARLHNMTVAISKGMQGKFSPLAENFGALQRQLVGLATKNAMIQLRAEVSNLAMSNIKELKEYMKTVASKADLSSKTERLHELSAELKQKAEVVKKCGEAPGLREALNQASWMATGFHEAKENIMNISSAGTQQCSGTPEELLLKLKEAASEQSNALESMATSTQYTESEFKIRLDILQGLIKQSNSGILEPTESPQQPVETAVSTTTARPTEPTEPPQCLDSTFRSDSLGDGICETAVTLRKCHLTFVAFHCCRSCMDAGLITSLPNYNASRDVPVLQARRFVSPKKG